MWHETEKLIFVNCWIGMLFLIFKISEGDPFSFVIRAKYKCVKYNGLFGF